MKLVAVLVVLAVLGVVAAVLVGAIRADMDEPTSSLPPSGLPEGDLVPEDLHAVRFSLGFRGYRMDEVDEVLDRAAAELARRDAEIERLRSGLTGDGTPGGDPSQTASQAASHAGPLAAGNGHSGPVRDGDTPEHRGEQDERRPAEDDQTDSYRQGATAASVAPASGRPDWSATDGTT